MFFNMSSPSLPMVPQWLEIAIGLNQPLGILLRIEKMKAQMPRFEMFPSCRHKGKCYLPFLCFARPENLAIEKMSYDRAGTKKCFPRETSRLANDRSMAVSPASLLLIVFKATDTETARPKESSLGDCS